MTVCLLLALLAACGHRQPYAVTGRIMNAVNGTPVSDATVHARSHDSLVSYSGGNGYYILSGLKRRDTVDVSAEGYSRSTFVVQFTTTGNPNDLHDVYLEPGVDTAFTAGGPVDASVFFNNPDRKQKKLSLNEVRWIVTKRFPGARIRKGALVKVSDRDEWLFEVRLGRASASVYLDAYSGSIRSIESDDPTLDKKLQSEVDH